MLKGTSTEEDENKRRTDTEWDKFIREPSSGTCKEHIPTYLSCPCAAEMVRATPFLLVLFLAPGAPGLSVTKCTLTGDWKNDLGSNMSISEVKENGDFTGTYKTSVSAHPNKIIPSPLLGSQHLPDQLKQPTFGFTVHWNFTKTVSVFTGQCFVDGEGKEVLKTMWLWRSHDNKIKDNWNATVVGYNIFERLETHMDGGW
ncbi:avidin-like [Oenanthe melanoleuca]|uniref:avidin-like n=1 Tax=Oenanthe melanoleuca TaxID=2939378 RepID=UPI0024C0E8A8|nr:avidin-like [Oenanthe melanoleuca]